MVTIRLVFQLGILLFRTGIEQDAFYGSGFNPGFSSLFFQSNRDFSD